MTLRKFSARKMLARTTEELKKMLQGEFTLVFDDGIEIDTNDVETHYSSYFWDIIRKYSFTPLTAAMHVGKVIKGGLAGSNTHLQLFSPIAWGVLDAADAQNLAIDRKVLADELGLMIYQQTNALYNMACVELERNVVSTDILDYVNLLGHPLVKPVLAAMQPNEDSITQTYATISDLIMKAPELANNPLVISARSGMVKMNQLLQCLVARGFVTDIDSLIFPEPAMGSFATGYADFYSFLVDTRTASKSLFFSAKLLRDTEYKSRKLQILCMSVETLYPGDCGSTHYLPWKLRGPAYDENGKMTRRSDLDHWVGKYFLDEETGGIRELKPTDEKYLGQMLRFRSTLAGCQHPDPHGMCMTCFGAMGKVIPENTNIGHMLAAALMQVLSQAILSVKHIDSSSSSAPIKLSELYKQWLAASPDGKGYFLAKGMKGKSVKLSVSADEVSNLSSINTTAELESLVIDQISEITSATFLLEDGNVPLEFMSDKRKASFTHDALYFIKETGWTHDDYGNYIFDLTDWPNEVSLMELPQRHFNTADHAEEITKLIQGSSDDKTNRKQDGSVFSYFYELYELVNNRLDVPAVILEHIIYGASIRSAENDDYRLPRAGTQRQMGLTSTTVPSRSMGAGIGFERHIKAIFSPMIFDGEKRSSHLFDAMVLPKEAVEDRNRRGLM